MSVICVTRIVTTMEESNESDVHQSSTNAGWLNLFLVGHTHSSSSSGDA